MTANLTIKNAVSLSLLGLSYVALSIWLLNVLPVYQLAQLLKEIVVLPLMSHIYAAATISSILLLLVNKHFIKLPGLFPGLVMSFFAGVYFLIIDPWPNINLQKYLIFPSTFLVMAFLVWFPLILNFVIQKK